MIKKLRIARHPACSPYFFCRRHLCRSQTFRYTRYISFVSRTFFVHNNIKCYISRVPKICKSYSEQHPKICKENYTILFTKIQSLTLLNFKVCRIRKSFMHKNPIYYMQKALATGAKNAPVHYLGSNFGTDFGTIPISETTPLSLKILSEIRATILPTSANWRSCAQNHSELFSLSHKIIANHTGSPQNRKMFSARSPQNLTFQILIYQTVIW